MSAIKRPSTSSLRRFVCSRPYVPVAELRRRFGLDEPDDMVRISRNGSSAYIGVPAREAAKLEELWIRDELGVELSVDVRAPVVVGVFPMRVARYMVDHNVVNGNAPNGPAPNGIGPLSRPDGELIDEQPV
ncbi:MAG: hypothetical protein WEE67_08385 [Chloroflexota bacterium]